MVYGAGLASLGHTVVGVPDSDATAAALNAAQPVVHEPGLPELMRRETKRKRLSDTTDYAHALKGAQFAYIAIDTPVDEQDRSNLAPIEDAARQIGRHRSGPLVLCVSAQVPVGTTHALGALAAAASSRTDASPVVVRARVPAVGTALETFFKADRVVVGADDPKIAHKVGALYKGLKRPVIETNVRTAEMGKHGSNAFLATSISFANELSNLCEEVGADATGMAAILKADRRIGPDAFLSPGLGFAGERSAARSSRSRRSARPRATGRR